MSNIARVTLSALRYGQVCQNVLHFQHKLAVWDAQSIVTDIVNNWIPQAIRFSGTQCVYKSVLAQCVNEPTLPTFTLAINIAGTQFDDQRCPGTTASVVKLSTGTGGRHGRGRIFFPGPASDAFQFGVHQATFSGQAQGFLDTLMAHYGPEGSSDLRLGILNRATKQLTFVTGMQLRTVPGVQRRRNIGIGI